MRQAIFLVLIKGLVASLEFEACDFVATNSVPHGWIHQIMVNGPHERIVTARVD